jgi:hypothetical protein
MVQIFPSHQLSLKYWFKQQRTQLTELTFLEWELETQTSLPQTPLEIIQKEFPKKFSLVLVVEHMAWEAFIRIFFILAKGCTGTEHNLCYVACSFSFPIS